MSDATASHWYDDRNLVIIWLLIFFPAGLVLLWRGRSFPGQAKWPLTGAVILIFLAFGGIGLFTLIYVLVLCPSALVLIWRDRMLLRQAKWIYSGCVAFVILMTLAGIDAGGSGSSKEDLQTGGGCEYFRGSIGNVIGRTC